MKGAIAVICFVLTITVSKKGLGQPPAKKTSGQTTPTNQKAKTTCSGTTILMDEKNQQKEASVPVRTNSGPVQNSTSTNKIIPQQPSRDSIFDMYDPGWIKQRGGKGSSFNDVIISSRTSKDVPAYGKKTNSDSSKTKQQAELRNKSQRN